MHRLVIPALWIAIGCGRIGFDTPGGGTGDPDGGGSNGGDGGGSSSSGSDGGSPVCTSVVPSTTFPGGIPCANWAANQAVNNAGMSESNGTLTITPNANSPGSEGKCERNNVTIGSGGAFTEVSQVLAGSSSTTRLEIVWADDTFYVGASNNGMRAGNINGGVTLSGGLVERWWRMRPIADQIVFETSPDGVTWNGFGTVGGVPSGTATLRVIARTPNAEATPGVARFESVNACP